MESAYQEFLERPTRDHYCLVQRMVLSSGVQQDALQQLIERIRARAYDHAILLQDEMGPTWLLSPSFHLWSARLAESVGDDEALELEQFQFHACLTGLLATGDGSRKSPFRVTYTSDVADLLATLGKESLVQHLVRRSDGFFDLVSCSDGTELFFGRPDLDTAHDAVQALPRAIPANLPSVN